MVVVLLVIARISLAKQQLPRNAAVDALKHNEKSLKGLQTCFQRIVFNKKDSGHLWNSALRIG